MPTTITTTHTHCCLPQSLHHPVHSHHPSLLWLQMPDHQAHFANLSPPPLQWPNAPIVPSAMAKHIPPPTSSMFTELVNTPCAPPAEAHHTLQHQLSHWKQQECQMAIQDKVLNYSINISSFPFYYIFKYFLLTLSNNSDLLFIAIPFFKFWFLNLFLNLFAITLFYFIFLSVSFSPLHDPSTIVSHTQSTAATHDPSPNQSPEHPMDPLLCQPESGNQTPHDPQQPWTNEQRCTQSLSTLNVRHQDLGNFFLFYFEFYLEFSKFHLLFSDIIFSHFSDDLFSATNYLFL